MKKDRMTISFTAGGKKIVFYSNRSGSQQVIVRDAEGRGAVQLTQAKALNNATPRWSTDGQWITYDSNLCGLFQIYRVSAEGGAVRNVTNDNTGMEVLRRWKRRMALRCVTSRNAADYGNRRAEGGAETPG